ncbi:hypothetical protein [Spiribacter salinus]|jgi:hypothetical protein|nr:hypothetical protein [Spiribacter salinus]MDR9414519.1 hypothetical protein [Spiribacter sp.]MDR9455122.1 hypothetical protein [Spiribacter sp.]
MSASEYLAIGVGLLAVWQGVERVLEWLTIREGRLLWTFSLPF